MNGPLPLILASTSPYRRELLGRLGIEFSTCSPDVDETRKVDETPDALVRRLAEAKARAVADRVGTALVIGSDQVAVDEGDVLGKPGTFERACEQLTQLSGKRVTFLTSLCLFNSATGRLQLDVVPFVVQFRQLSASQVQNYLRREQPFNCAGSFKSEGLGIALFAGMNGEDPTALIGLPLIRLSGMLEVEGRGVLG